MLQNGATARLRFSASVVEITQEHRILQMSGEIETAQIQAALKEIEDAYSQFRESGIGRMEFPLAKRMYKREVDNALQKPVNMAFVVFLAMRKDFNKDRLSNTYESITAMKRADANDIVSNSLPAYDDLLKVVVSPDSKSVEGACVISKLEDARRCLN